MQRIKLSVEDLTTFRSGDPSSSPCHRPDRTGCSASGWTIRREPPPENRPIPQPWSKTRASTIVFAARARRVFRDGTGFRRYPARPVAGRWGRHVRAGWTRVVEPKDTRIPTICSEQGGRHGLWGAGRTRARAGDVRGEGQVRDRARIRVRHTGHRDAVHLALAHRRRREDPSRRDQVEPGSWSGDGSRRDSQGGADGTHGTNAIVFRTRITC